MARKPSSPKRPSSNAASDERDIEKDIIDAALALAAERSWSRLALADIAAAANLGLIDLYRRFSSKSAILRAFSRRIDAATIAVPTEAEGIPRDRLFEVLMRRLDLLTPYKPGLRRIAHEACRGRIDALALACHLPRTLAWMLEAAGVSASGIKGAVRIRLLGLAYLATMRVWLEDDTPDLARTMAALDRALRRSEPFMAMGSRPTAAAAGEAAA
jgi:AcrR family transcriptional regulator